MSMMGFLNSMKLNQQPGRKFLIQQRTSNMMISAIYLRVASEKQSDRANKLTVPPATQLQVVESKTLLAPHVVVTQVDVEPICRQYEDKSALL